MDWLAGLPFSYVVMGAGVLLLLLGAALAAVAAVRRLNDLGEVLCGLFLGSGLALLALGTSFNIDYHVPPDTNVLSRAAGAQSTAPQVLSYGEAYVRDIQQWSGIARSRLYYTVPTCAALILLLFSLFSARWMRWLTGEGFALGMRGFLTALLIPLAALAVGNYTDFGKFRYNTYFNAYEFYHYYIGTKYAPEVGYSNMYNASLVADDETGARHKTGKQTIRDLSDGKHKPKEQFLKKAEEYKARFTPERWQEFLKDIRFFKAELTAGRWNGMLSDKGYNGTPFWTMWVGGLLSENVDTANRKGMLALSLLDPMLITIAALCVWRAFGLRAMLVMIVVLGTSYVMKYSHMKGAFLRTDFAMSLVIAVCMLKLNHYRTAGALMMYAALSRVFPAVFFFGAGVKLLQSVIMHWRPSAARLLRGALLAAILAVAIGLGLHFAAPEGWMAALAARVPKLPEYLSGMALVITFETLAALAVGGGLAALWLFNATPQCRPYVRLFASALSVLVLFSAAVLADPRTGVPYVEDFAKKIDRHLGDFSPWRVGYKYLFINVPGIQNERLKLASAQAPKTLLPAAGPTESSDELEPGESDNTPAIKVAATATAEPQDPQRVERVFKDTYLDMRYTAEKVAKRMGERDGEKQPEGILAQAGDYVHAFFKTYVPSTRGTLYKTHENEWKWTMIIMLLLSLVAVLGLKDHEALAWSFVPTFFLVAPTYYYYIMLLIPLLFFTSALERPSRLFGAVLLVAAAMPGYMLYGDMYFGNLGYGQQFTTYYWHSVMYLVIVGYMALLAYWDTLLAGIRFLRRQQPT